MFFCNNNKKSPSALVTTVLVLISLCLWIPGTFGGTKNLDLVDSVEILAPCSGLNCWLKNLTFHLPDQKFVIKEIFEITILLTNGICKNIQIDGLNSSLVPPNGIYLHAGGIGLNCSIDFAYESIFSGNGSAEAVVDDASLNLTMQLVRGPDQLAIAANMTACDSKVDVREVNFNIHVWKEILELLDGLVKDLIQSGLPKIICSELSGLIDKNLTETLQKIDKTIRPFLHPTTPAPAPPIPPGMSNWKTNPFMGLVDYMLNDLVGANGVLGINKIMDRFTAGTGAISVSNLLLSFPIPGLSEIGNFTVGLLGFNITGLNTFKNLDLLVPVDNYTVSSDISLESLNISVDFSVNATLGSGILQGSSLYEKGQLIADISHNDLNSSMVLAVNGSQVASYAVNQLLSLGCWMSSINDLNITYLNLNFSMDQLLLKAKGGNAEKELDAVIDDVIELFIQSYRPAAPAFFDGFVAGPLRKYLNTKFDEFKQAKSDCANSEEIEDNTFNKKSTIWVMISAVSGFVLFGIILFFASEVRNQRKNAFAAPLLRPKKNDDSNEVLVFHPRLHIVIRLLVPLALLLNVAVFISSNTSVGASVYARINVGAEHVQFPALFQFTLANCVHDMWIAGVYPLSLLIAIFSGAWPYLKVVLMFFCWIVPVTILNTKRREQLLMLIDVLGKWSLIDAFVMVLMLVAFHFVIIPPVSPDSPAFGSNVYVYVEPNWGFYSFLLATIMSLVLTHIILACHRHAVHKPGEIEHTEQIQTKECLFTHGFKFHPALAPFRPLLIVLVVLFLLLSIALLVVGATFDSFEFQFKGAIALVLNFLEGTATRHYSLLTLGNEIPPSSLTPNSFGIRVIQATLFGFSFAIPLAYLTSLLVLWLVPMTYKLQRRLYVATEIFQAWSTLEVFIISVIAAILEIQQFAQFIVGDRCDLINKLLAEFMSQDLDEPKCFDVRASLDSGCWILFCSCAVYIVVGTIVIRTCHQALAEREAAASTVGNSIPTLPENGYGHEAAPVTNGTGPHIN